MVLPTAYVCFRSSGHPVPRCQRTPSTKRDGTSSTSWGDVSTNFLLHLYVKCVARSYRLQRQLCLISTQTLQLRPVVAEKQAAELSIKINQITIINMTQPHKNNRQITCFRNRESKLGLMYMISVAVPTTPNIVFVNKFKKCCI